MLWWIQAQAPRGAARVRFQLLLRNYESLVLLGAVGMLNVWLMYGTFALSWKCRQCGFSYLVVCDGGGHLLIFSKIIFRHRLVSQAEINFMQV